MKGIFLMIGGNIENRMRYIEKTKSEIESKIGRIVNSSSIFETIAWGNESQPAFLNQALEINTSLTPEKLLETCLEIELYLGRKRLKKNDARTVDIDILFYKNEIIHTKNIEIPHPRLHLRNFVLAPLNEICPNKIHPILRKKISSLFKSSTDKLDVKIFTAKY